MILDLLANNDWNRPIYFAITTGASAYIGLDKHFQIEGLTYRLVPMKTDNGRGETGYVHTDKMYDNIMNKFEWGGMDKNEIYMNENNRRMCMNLRNNFSRLADALTLEGKKDKAIEVLDRCVEVIPERNVPYDYFMIPVAKSYYGAGELEKGNVLSRRMFELFKADLMFMLDMDRKQMAMVKPQIGQSFNLLRQVMYIVSTSKQQDLIDELTGEFSEIEQGMLAFRQYFPEMGDQLR